MIKTRRVPEMNRSLEVCQHPTFSQIKGSVEFPGINPVRPVTILICSKCGHKVVLPEIVIPVEAN